MAHNQHNKSSHDRPRPNDPRSFALDVVLRLRDAGFEAYWAGGCVRDMLLSVEPKDFDVATNALPDQVVQIFGRRRTFTVGESFGVVVVLGPTKRCGQIEVATFRSDGDYKDGRRPSTVSFCSAEEDAKRRDFTINGMFYDPVSDRVIDYVGGREDLQRRIVRAIGAPEQRFAEDKLRMLRAVRFAATLRFSLDPATEQAILHHAAEIQCVSAERIGQELRRVLADTARATGWQKLVDTTLADYIFPPEVVRLPVPQVCAALNALHQPDHRPSFALLLHPLFDPAADNEMSQTERVRQWCIDFRLAGAETNTICWLLAAEHQCQQPEQRPLHVLKTILADERRDLLIDFVEAMAVFRGESTTVAEYLRNFLANVPPEKLAPPPLLAGKDLMQLGMKPGPHFGSLLAEIRRAQLDEEISTREEALEMLKRLQQIENGRRQQH